jgi:hypothetical protein
VEPVYSNTSGEAGLRHGTEGHRVILAYENCSNENFQSNVGSEENACLLAFGMFPVTVVFWPLLVFSHGYFFLPLCSLFSSPRFDSCYILCSCSCSCLCFLSIFVFYAWFFYSSQKGRYINTYGNFSQSCLQCLRCITQSIGFNPMLLCVLCW